MRVRIARLLVDEAVLRAVALDQDWTLCVLLDTYLRTGTGDPVSLLEAAEPFARTEEVLALLRDYYERAFAENAAWWYRNTGHKVLFWSTSTHAAKGRTRAVAFPPAPASGSPNAGSHLQDRRRPRYLSIGLTFGDGELATYSDARPRRVPRPAPPLAESVLDSMGNWKHIPCWHRCGRLPMTP
ncbi:erythromycin esterase family protein [Streptomyces sp. S1A(2023)]